MPTIVFASPKGGAGKTTSSFILASELANKNLRTIIVDADPNHPIAKWEKKGGVSENLSIMVSNDEENILDDIEKASQMSDFVIVDLEGTANLSVGYAIARADFVIIPSQRSTLDAGEAAKAIGLIKSQEKLTGKKIPFAILLTRTNPAIRSKGLHRMIESLENNHIETFITELNEREAFKAVFDHTKTLSQLEAKDVSGIERAKNNAQQYAAEVIKKIQNSQQTKEGRAA